MAVATLYDIMGLKAKNSIYKSVVLYTRNGDRHANVKIDIEAYDQTFLNAYQQKGEDYIFQQLEKQLVKKEVRQRIAQALRILEFEGALVTLYGGHRHAEMYFHKNGVNQYGIDWSKKG